jgi:signal transduction histidine kinase/CheY-like chemotaxis protein
MSAEEIRPPWLLSPQKQNDGRLSEEVGVQLVDRVRLGQLESAFLTCMRADGTQFEAEISAKLFYHEDRELVVVTVRDLTEQRKLEEQLHQAQKLDALGQLAGGVAHDFNNMLTAILASAEMLTADEPEEVQRELRGTIVSAAERAAQLTGKLLAFARKGKIRSTPTDVHKVIRETVALLKRTLDRKIEITTELTATRSIVLGDGSQLQSALLNLGVNARDAMPEGGSIVFRTTDETFDAPEHALGAFRVSPGDYVRISVRDSGTGISEENLKYVFDPFFTTKEVGKGTGLGLAAVFGTMASHKGAVTVESDLGQGTCFSLYLPLTVEAEPKERSDVARLPKGQGVILVVDDEDLVRTATSMQVESLGYVAIAEGEPLRAIETFERIHATLSAVLLDLVMPRMSGFDVMVRLREIDASVPIILVSGFPRTDQLDVTTQGRSGTGFLQKPFTASELRRLLCEICGTQDPRMDPSTTEKRS